MKLNDTRILADPLLYVNQTVTSIRRDESIEPIDISGSKRNMSNLKVVFEVCPLPIDLIILGISGQLHIDPVAR